MWYEYLKGIYVDDGRSVMDKLKIGTRFTGEKLEWDEGYESEDTEKGITREALTVREITKAMNSINEDIQFTTEV